MFDAQAQYKVVKHNSLRDYTNKAESLMDIEDVRRANGESVQAQKEEITRSVPIGCTEGLVDNPKINDPEKDYKSHAGGGAYGPTSTAFAKTTGECLADVFLLFSPIDFWETVAQETNRCGSGDWVCPASGREDEDDDSINSNDSNPNKEPDDMNEDLDDEGDTAAPTTSHRKKSPKGKGWKLCKKKDDGAWHRYHETKYKPWIKVIPGSLLVYHSILMIRGVTKLRIPDLQWNKTFNSLNPNVANTMTKQCLQLAQEVHSLCQFGVKKPTQERPSKPQTTSEGTASH